MSVVLIIALVVTLLTAVYVLLVKNGSKEQENGNGSTGY